MKQNFLCCQISEYFRILSTSLDKRIQNGYLLALALLIETNCNQFKSIFFHLSMPVHL